MGRQTLLLLDLQGRLFLFCFYMTMSTVFSLRVERSYFLQGFTLVQSSLNLFIIRREAFLWEVDSSSGTQNIKIIIYFISGERRFKIILGGAKNHKECLRQMLNSCAQFALIQCLFKTLRDLVGDHRNTFAYECLFDGSQEELKVRESSQDHLLQYKQFQYQSLRCQVKINCQKMCASILIDHYDTISPNNLYPSFLMSPFHRALFI